MSANGYGYGRRNAGPSPVDELKKRIREHRLDGAFLFRGPEEYTKDFYAGKIRALVADAPLPEFNYVLFDAERQSPGDLADAVETLPYMWEKKVIEIRNLKSASCTVEDGEQYARILEDIPDYATVLIFQRAADTAGAKNAGKSAGTGAESEGDGETKAKTAKKNGFSLIEKAVEQYGLIVDFDYETGDKLAAWADKHLEAAGVKTERGFSHALIAYCGPDMYTLQSEITKLRDAYGGKPLTERDIRTYCCSNESAVFFDIASCLNRRDIGGARKLLSTLRMTRESVPMSVGYLASNYQLMMIVRAGMDAGISNERIASEHKLPFWRVSKAAQSLREGNVSARRLTFAMKAIAEADGRMKNLRGDPVAALELLIYSICAYGEN